MPVAAQPASGSATAVISGIDFEVRSSEFNAVSVTTGV
jgi:hypothetical protein